MNLPNSTRIRYEPLRSAAFGAFAGPGYVNVGTSLVNPARIIEISNTTNVNMIYSWDGITDQAFIAAGTAKIVDYGSNKADQAGYSEQPAGDILWMKPEAASPASGNIYFTVIYLSQV
jgi:hypothetical protein